jgi:hypothetical protein
VVAFEVDRILSSPDLAQNLEILVGSRITLVVAEPIAVAPLILVIPAHEHMDLESSGTKVIGRRHPPSRHRRRDEPRAMGDEHLEALGHRRD